MAKSVRGTQLHAFAVIGARMRVQELQAEIDRIKKQFGGRTLRLGRKEPARPAAIPNEGPDGRTGPRKKRKISAAGRKAIGDAARKRWAKVNAEKAAESGGTAKGGKKR